MKANVPEGLDMKKISSALLILAYLAVAFSTVFFLPYRFYLAIMITVSVVLGFSWKFHEEVKKDRDKLLADYFKVKERWPVALGILGLAFLMSDKSLETFLTFIICLMLAFFWQILQIQFLRKYYFKNA